jgi:hypothetical protein
MTQCRQCGRELGEHTLDIAFSLPDVVWELSDRERKRRAKFSSDVCVLDENRFFIRGVAFVSILGTDQRFGWGLWAEVDASAFRKYLEVFKADARGEAPVPGAVANSPRGYPALDGHGVDLHFGTARERPTMTLHASAHPLSLEQQRGIAMVRVHEINELLHRKAPN